MMLITGNMETTPTMNDDPMASGNWTGLVYFVVTGNGDRDHNEDFFGHAVNGDTLTFVVSDGVGGQAGGSAASRLVVDLVRNQALSFDREEMLRGYDAIEQEIRRRQESSREYEKMGATVAELRIDVVRQMALWGHFGDSRVYWFRNKEILSVTNDHSVVKSLVTAGLISELDATNHSKKNILLGAFGITADIAPEVSETPAYLAEGDAFLLCTDGLWNYVPDDQIVKILSQSGDVASWVKALESRVRQAPFSNKDNYTILGVWITSAYDRTIRRR
jgi:serine/threonine protein phosphatase PrpC